MGYSLRAALRPNEKMVVPYFGIDDSDNDEDNAVVVDNGPDKNGQDQEKAKKTVHYVSRRYNMI